MILYGRTPATECRLRHDAISCARLLVYDVNGGGDAYYYYFFYFLFSVINRPYARDNDIIHGRLTFALFK